MKKLLSFCVVTLVMLCSIAGSFAVDCDDPIGAVGADVEELKIAVAANFYNPLLDMIQDSFFQDPDYGANTSVTICPGATGDLVADILLNASLPTKYGYFFAADGRAAQLAGNPNLPNTGSPYDYVQGIPVLFAETAVGTMDEVTDLIPSAPDPIDGVSTIDGSASGYPLDTVKAATVAFAKPDTAPYGNAACKIMNDMGVISSPSACPAMPASLPNWLAAPYVDIAATYDSVIDGDSKSAFVSKAQVCTALGSGALQIIEFTSSYYTLAQSAIMLDSTNVAASNLDNFIKNMRTPDGEGQSPWKEFAEEHCYLYP